MKLVNVRVLGKTASGGRATSSQASSGPSRIGEYDIRIINLSLGHPVAEPSLTDPLCIAVMNATDAGIVVIVSAGNSGKAADGAPILGGITSPGNSPYAITVGAINTKATCRARDDVMTTYSSRGPTKFEHAVKPDVVAPGNKIVSLEASGTYLQRNYPQFHMAGNWGNCVHAPQRDQHVGRDRDSGRRLVDAGASEHLCHAAENRAAKRLDLHVGRRIDGWRRRQRELLDEPEGSRSGLTNLVSTLVGGVLTPAGGAVFWDSGNMTKRLYAGTGLRLLSLLEAPLAWLTGGYLKWGDLNVIGLTNPLSQTHPNEILWGDVSKWTADQEILWGDTIYTPEGQEILWGDSRTTEGDEILWGDSTERTADE